jgi:hypothetical protein
MDVSLPVSRTKATLFPSGEKAGRKSIAGPRVRRRATRVSRSTSHSQPRAETATPRPSGATAGSPGPAFRTGSS